MKKFISLVLAVSMMMSIMIGCSKNETTGDVTTEVKVTTADTETTTEAAKSEDPVEITFYTWSQLNGYPENMVAAFEAANPDIKVNIEIGSQSVDEYLQMQKVKFLSGEAIDVTTVRPEMRKEYVDAGYLLDLSDQQFLSNFNQSYLDMVAVDGKVYSAPYALDVMGTIYNKTMFEENGWSVPTNQKEWLELCDVISAAGILPTINGYKDSWPILCEVAPFLHEVYVKDPEIFTKINNGEAKYTDANFVEAFTKINDFFHSSAVSKDVLGIGYDQSAADFATGKAAMMVHGEWVVGSIKTASPAFEIGVFPLLHNAEGGALTGSVSIGQSNAVSALSQHPEASLRFLEYISSVEGATFFANAMGNFTPVTGVKSDNMAIWEEVLKLPALDFYYNLQYPGAQAEMQKMFQLMSIGEVTPEEALENIQTEQDKKGQ
ncbi:MAG: extracellular solute-binding protein [Vallitaleaceae bacterium]|nr:extracellular solute-binding protein [Vallitaleaceae bacterium]